MKIRVSWHGWTFELQDEGWLLIKGDGREEWVHAPQLAPEDISAFAQGWVCAKEDSKQ